jgi:excisionase family DNA binding protein
MGTTDEFTPGARLDELPDVLTVREVARFLRIGKNHAYDLVKQGRIPAVALGRRKIVLKTALQRALDTEGGLQ